MENENSALEGLDEFFCNLILENNPNYSRVIMNKSISSRNVISEETLGDLYLSKNLRAVTGLNRMSSHFENVKIRLANLTLPYFKTIVNSHHSHFEVDLRRFAKNILNNRNVKILFYDGIFHDYSIYNNSRGRKCKSIEFGINFKLYIPS